MAYCKVSTQESSYHMTGDNVPSGFNMRFWCKGAPVKNKTPTRESFPSINIKDHLPNIPSLPVSLKPNISFERMKDGTLMTDISSSATTLAGKVADTSVKAYQDISSVFVDKKTTLDTVNTSPKEESKLLYGTQTTAAQKQWQQRRGMDPDKSETPLLHEKAPSREEDDGWGDWVDDNPFKRQTSEGWGSNQAQWGSKGSRNSSWDDKDWGQDDWKDDHNDWNEDGGSACKKQQKNLVKKTDYKPAKSKHQNESENLLIDFDEKDNKPSSGGWNDWEDDEEAWASLSNGRSKGKHD